jgi:hypothetical protein
MVDQREALTVTTGLTEAVARMESFRALKLSRVKTLMEHFLTLKLSELESFRALNLSNLATGSIWTLFI